MQENIENGRTLKDLGHKLGGDMTQVVVAEWEEVRRKYPSKRTGVTSPSYFRSASVREISITRKGIYSNLPKARLAIMDPALHRGKNSK